MCRKPINQVPKLLAYFWAGPYERRLTDYTPLLSVGGCVAGDATRLSHGAYQPSPGTGQAPKPGLRGLPSRQDTMPARAAVGYLQEVSWGGWAPRRRG